MYCSFVATLEMWRFVSYYEQCLIGKGCSLFKKTFFYVSETFNVPSVYLQCHVTGMMKKLADSSYLLVDEENMAQ